VRFLFWFFGGLCFGVRVRVCGGGEVCGVRRLQFGLGRVVFVGGAGVLLWVWFGARRCVVFFVTCVRLLRVGGRFVLGGLAVGRGVGCIVVDLVLVWWACCVVLVVSVWCRPVGLVGVWGGVGVSVGAASGLWSLFGGLGVSGGGMGVGGGRVGFLCCRLVKV